MNGRATFAKFGMWIKFSVRIVKAIPRPLNNCLWWITSGSNGRAALLFRYAFLKAYSRSVGVNVYVGSNCVFKNVHGLIIGDNVSIHDFCYIDAVGSIEIASDVSIAHASSIVSFDHGYEDRSLAIKYNPVKLLPVKIERDVWVGCGVRILGGTSIGARSILAAGAVVRGSVQSSSLYGGVPAKLLKTI